MTLHELTSLAISAHAVSRAWQAVTNLPRYGARDDQRAKRAEREAERRWLRVRKRLIGKRRIAA